MAYTRIGYANFAAFPATGSANVIYVDLSNGNEYLWSNSAYIVYTGTQAGVRLGYQDAAWFAANPTFLLGKGQKVHLLQTGTYKIGDGVSDLQTLSFLGGGSTPNIQAVLTAGNVAITTIETTGFIKTGGTSAQFLKADGSVDSNAYITAAALSPYFLTASFTDSAVTSKVLTGYVSGAGTVSATDTILQAIQKLNGNIAAIQTGLIVGTTTITSGTNTRILYNNAGVVGEYSVTGTGTTAVLSTSPTFTTSIITPLIYGGSGTNSILTFQNTSGTTTSTGAAYVFKAGSLGSNLITINQRDFTFSPYDTSGSSTTCFTFTNSFNTNQTASTNIPNFKVTGSTKQWATGALATQYFNYFSANTVSFVGPSTASKVYGLYVEKSVVGTLATITTNIGIGTDGHLEVGGGIIYGTTTANFIQLDNGIGAKFAYNSSNLITVGNTNLTSTLGGSQLFSFQNVGGQINYNFTPASLSALTASTELVTFQITGNTKQFGTGALALQRFTYFSSNTLAFVGASTCTLAANFVADYVQGGTNATITTSAAIYVPTLALTNTNTSYGAFINHATGATNNYAVGTSSGVSLFGNAIIGNWVTSSSYFVIAHSSATISTGYSLISNGTNVVLNASNITYLSVNDGNQCDMNSTRFRFQTGVEITGGYNIILGTTTGTKIGTATTQKLSFWNATPIVQPTTAVTSSTIVGGAGTTVKEDHTFDGYTIAQVVKALRNTGLLA